MKRNAFFLIVLAMTVVTAHGGDILSGQIWPDDRGHHINAHGGGILFYNNTYYWYGEHNADTTSSAYVGVTCYESKNLTDWTYRGVALEVSNEKGSDIERGCILERPKVVYCKITGKFVMWFHLELKGKGYASARYGVAVSDSPTGPFTYLSSDRVNKGYLPFNITKEEKAILDTLDISKYEVQWTPAWMEAVKKGLFLKRDLDGGQMARDQTVFIDDDGKGYHIFSSEENMTMHIAELTDDYQAHTGRYVRMAPGGQNEAPTIFKKDGTYWMITSGCTGWEPNAARMFSAKSIWGPWTQHPNPFVGQNSEISYGSQGTFVLPVGSNFIFMADMWCPKHPINARYLWLPIEFNDGKPSLVWNGEWNMSIFDEDVLNEHPISIARGDTLTLPMTLQPESSYLLKAIAKTESGADNLSILVDGLGKNNTTAASAKADWTEICIPFNVSAGQKEGAVRIIFDSNQTGDSIFVGRISLSRKGDFHEVHYTGIPASLQREVKADMGVEMQPDSKIKWMLDDKLGMFVHWGLYAGPGRGEWHMENQGVSIDNYRQLAYPASGEDYFDASHFDAHKWVGLAKKMGARYMNMVTEHHDGYALFDSQYMTSFTSKQTHNRDFVREYVDACREAGLKVGLYKTLINWRYPGYYDVTGKDCKANNFGYTTEGWHHENARLMKEELYQQVKELMTNYGKIDQLFWDGGWLAQCGPDAEAAYFWEPGKYLSEDNEWPVNPYFQTFDTETGKPLGLMGMVRQLQPDIVVNPRSGWIGDYTCEEGGGDVKGDIRSGVVEKCMTLTPAWGYTPTAEDSMRVSPLAIIKRICSDCMIRNMCFLINIGPDRHGDVPQAVEKRIEEFGQWVHKNAPAIYQTTGGPWQPVDGKYGFTYRGNMLYVYLLDGFDSDTLILPPVDKGMKARRAYILDTNQKVALSQHQQTIVLNGLNHQKGDITIIALELNKNVR